MFGLVSSSKASQASRTSKAGGPGYIILNIIRTCNIIALGTVIAGSWIMLVRTVQTSNFFFFDAFSHLITSFISMFLIVSELSIFKSYFAKDWPLLSDSTGFLFLGSSMFILGMNVLGNLNKVATSVENLGLPMWRVVIAGGCLSAIFGAVNVLVTFIFGNKKLGITCRMVRSHGAATPPAHIYTKSIDDEESSYTAPSVQLPSYHTPSEAPRRSRFDFRSFRSSFISKPMPVQTEEVQHAEDRASPIIPGIQRPPTAMHPAYSPSRYSVASRF